MKKISILLILLLLFGCDRNIGPICESRKSLIEAYEMCVEEPKCVLNMGTIANQNYRLKRYQEQCVEE
jgi:hypothetical protein